MNTPKISVILISFNGSKYIREQIISILDQLGKDNELVISDDHSSDDTIKIIKSIEDIRIKLYQNPVTIGIVNNFEKALSYATGDIFFFSDQDDIWYENKIETSLKFLANHDMVISNCIIYDQLAQKSLGDSYGLFGYRTSVFNSVLLNSSSRGCCMACKKIVVDFALPFPPNLESHDLWFGLVTKLFFKTVYIKEPLLLYRRHDQNNSVIFSNRPIYKKIGTRISFWLKLPLLVQRSIQREAWI